jgi:hypothetical protein
MFAIAVFSAVSIISLNIMNSGISATESNMEITAARSEISAQAAALRFIHNAFVGEFEYPESSHYVAVWNQIAGRAINSNDLLDLPAVTSCEAMYDSAAFAANAPFIINTRRLSFSPDMAVEAIEGAVITPGDLSIDGSRAPFAPSLLNPRIVFAGAGDSDAELKEEDEYRDVVRVEGIWITAVKGDVFQLTGVPKYYDFYVRTCWVPPGRQYPTKLGTIVRLYNPQGEYEVDDEDMP